MYFYRYKIYTCIFYVYFLPIEALYKVVVFWGLVYSEWLEWVLWIFLCLILELSRFFTEYDACDMVGLQ
jgi:hypothetical protein